jgi:hypothetical protein
MHKIYYMSQYINTLYYVTIINFTLKWPATLLTLTIQKYTVIPFYNDTCMDIVFSVIWQNESCLLVMIHVVEFLESLKNKVLIAYVKDNSIKVKDWLFKRWSQVYFSIFQNRYHLHF